MFCHIHLKNLRSDVDLGIIYVIDYIWSHIHSSVRIYLKQCMVWGMVQYCNCSHRVFNQTALSAGSWLPMPALLRQKHLWVFIHASLNNTILIQSAKTLHRIFFPKEIKFGWHGYLLPWLFTRMSIHLLKYFIAYHRFLWMFQGSARLFVNCCIKIFFVSVAKYVYLVGYFFCGITCHRKSLRNSYM